MKYVVILGDGMADRKIDILNNRTPLQVANKPMIDYLAQLGEVGLCKSVPDGMKPGSDVANLSIMGYNPLDCYTGRSPLEAVSIGIELKDTDVSLRCNLVTLSNEEKLEDRTMIDYSAGEITTEESTIIVNDLAKALNSDRFKLYSGISYRHCLIVENGSTNQNLTPPHDISGKKIMNYLPTGDFADEFITLMKKAEEILKNHPINLKRISEGKNPANSIWLWGAGTKPQLDNFEKKYGVKGAVISAVDLVKGIGILAGMKNIDVEGATGNIDTNFEGKANAVISALKDGYDYVYLHMEAPDECGHHGDIDGKILSIEKIDMVVTYILTELDKMGEDFSILITPDHPTPIEIKTHSSEEVPFLIYRSTPQISTSSSAYDEDNAKNSGLYVKNGEELMKKFLTDY